jgi:hypothetical protein
MYGVAGDLAIELGGGQRLGGLIDLIEQPDRLQAGTRGHYLRLRGMAARDSAPDEVEPLLREAAAAFAAWGSPLWRARVLADLGVWLARQGAGERAAEVLDGVRATYEELGANGLLAALDERLAGTR